MQLARLAPTVALAALLAFPATAAAQSIGLIGGASFGNVAGSDVPGGTFSNRNGFLAGIILDNPVGDIVGLRSGAYYIQKGAKIEFTNPDGEASVKGDYIEIPFLLVIGPQEGNVRPEAFVGGATAFKVSCNVSASDPTGSFESTCADFGADIRSWDFSAQFGGALNIGMVRVGAAYDLGLVTIDPNEFLDVKSRALMFFATVSFGVKRR